MRANDVGDSDRRPVGIATFFDVQPSTPGASRVVDNDLHGTFSVAIASKGSDANVKRNTVKGRFDAGIDTTQVLVPDGVGAPVDYFASLPAEAFHSQVVDNDLTLQGNGSGVAIVTEPGAVVRGNHLAGF
ncbi:MAG: hypothetical protein U1F43_10735 [Myxococcota bacterium]